MARPRVPATFPFKEIFTSFLKEYGSQESYWYIPKRWTVNDANIEGMAQTIEILGDHLDDVWDRTSQDAILNELRDKGVAAPTTKGTLADRTALVRISMALLETLGLVWVEEDKHIFISDAGYALWLAGSEDERRSIIERQIAKYQYPETLRRRYAREFRGLIPHIFLLQVLREVNYQVSEPEFELFVNVAQGHDDLSRVVPYIKAWRDLSEGEQDQLLELARRVPRYRTISLDASYQRAFLTYAHYLDVEHIDGMPMIVVIADPEDVDALLDAVALKVPTFETPESWIAYYGDPEQQPDWFTYLAMEVRRAETPAEAERIVEENKDRLTEEQAEELERRQVEKHIEDFYEKNLHLLEPGLKLVKSGRQYDTPIGTIDLLCRDKEGRFVVIEVKAKEAEDSVFGQIQRYMGWVHMNVPGGRNNVRGIILASGFSDKARYSRIGLLRDDANELIKFKKHTFTPEDVG